MGVRRVRKNGKLMWRARVVTGGKLRAAFFRTQWEALNAEAELREGTFERERVTDPVATLLDNLERLIALRTAIDEGLAELSKRFADEDKRIAATMARAATLLGPGRQSTGQATATITPVSAATPATPVPTRSPAPVPVMGGSATDQVLRLLEQAGASGSALSALMLGVTASCRASVAPALSKLVAAGHVVRTGRAQYRIASGSTLLPAPAPPRGVASTSIAARASASIAASSKGPPAPAPTRLTNTVVQMPQRGSLSDKLEARPARLVQVLASAPDGGFSIDEIMAGMGGVGKSTVYGMLGQLDKQGRLYRPDKGRYRLASEAVSGSSDR
jgi:hypothetical protein